MSIDLPAGGPAGEPAPPDDRTTIPMAAAGHAPDTAGGAGQPVTADSSQPSQTAAVEDDTRQNLTATAVRQAKFLSAFETVCTVGHAAELAGIARQTHYDWLRDDPEYRKSFSHARLRAVEALELEARKRAVSGRSDKLLMFLLRAWRPRRYGTRVTTEHSGEVGVRSNEMIEEARNLRHMILGKKAYLDGLRAAIEIDPDPEAPPAPVDGGVLPADGEGKHQTRGQSDRRDP